LSAIFHEIADAADVLIGNEEDFQLALGLEGPESGGEDLSQKLHSFKDMLGIVRGKYTNCSVVATTLREVVSVNRHLWGAIINEGDNWHIAPVREIDVLDRIGGGDGFVGGMLYAVLKGWEPEKWVQFGWATGALAVTTVTDYAAPADEAQVWSIWKGNARVLR